MSGRLCRRSVYPNGKLWYNYDMLKIISADNFDLIRSFVDFPETLYRGDDRYVPYMRRDLIRTLNDLVLRKKTYTALLATDGDRILGRILFTVDKNKQLATDRCGFFSLFECVNDQKVCNLLLDETVSRLKQSGAEYLSGTYFPHDPDNRRGILYRGFERAPLIFTSYNPPYYNELLSTYGLQKHTDAYEYRIDFDKIDLDKLASLADYVKKRCKFHIDTVDWAHLDRDIADVHTVMQAASNEVIYQETPSIEALSAVVKQWRRFLCKDYILIARTDADNTPIGFAMALPDFFELFRKMRGRLDLKGIGAFLIHRKKIRALRAILQYVVPDYQSKGAVIALYHAMLDAAVRNGVTYAEAGTMMEQNDKANRAVRSVGGELERVYRIYYGAIQP